MGRAIQFAYPWAAIGENARISIRTMWQFVKKSIQFLYSLYAFFVFFSTGIITLIYYVLISPLPNNTRLRAVYAFNRIWMKTWGYLTGFIFEVNGHDRIEREEVYVIMANHVNILDIFTMASHIQHPFMPLAKKEVYRIPILGQLVALNAIPVDRSSPESRAESMKNMIRKMELGTSILIFPEGTRNRTRPPSPLPSSAAPLRAPAPFARGWASAFKPRGLWDGQNFAPVSFNASSAGDSWPGPRGLPPRQSPAVSPPPALL